jgi:predicted DsbA family dithiol-disulfide isomerase
MEIEKVKIEIWSDIVCPFCYIGKKKLEQAIKKLEAQDKVEIVWHSYQLDPDFPEGTSIPSSAYLSQRKGYSVSQIEGIHRHLADQAKAYGIDFEFGKALSFNTRNTHRLWQWSRQFNKQSALKEALMKAYFTDGTDLSVQENLLAVAERTGLDKIEAGAILNGDQFEQQVEMDIYQARQLGIRGVPYFLINEKAGISGAQPDQVFENHLSAALHPEKISSAGFFRMQ